MPPNLTAAAALSRERPASSLAVPRSVPGTVAPEKTTAEGGGLTGAILKVPGRFYIQPRDSDGRAVAASLADVFRIHIVGLETPQHSIVELDDGRLEVRWLPCVSGDFKLIITINGMHIIGSPFKAGAANGRIDASQSEPFVGIPAQIQPPGSTAQWTIGARDQMGNLASYPPLATAKRSFDVRVEGPYEDEAKAQAGVEKSDVLTKAAAMLTPLDMGVQQASLQLTKVGTYCIRASARTARRWAHSGC